MRVAYRPKSLLAAVLIASIMALFLGLLVDNKALVSAAKPFIWIAGGLALAFILMSLARNLRGMR